MTCIVGLVDGGKVYIGGDSAGGPQPLTTRADSKVFRNGPFLMGFTTSFRMGQLLRYSFCPPVRCPDQDVFRYMVTDFVDAVRACLKVGGFARKDEEVETGGTFLVGYEGRLFAIYGDYQVAESQDGYQAIGCGEELALGALFATATLPPAERVRRALFAAAHFSGGVVPPLIILEI